MKKSYFVIMVLFCHLAEVESELELFLEEFTETTFSDLGGKLLIAYLLEWVLGNYKDKTITTCKDSDEVTKSVVGGHGAAGKVNSRIYTEASRYILLPPHYLIKVEVKLLQIDKLTEYITIVVDNTVEFTKINNKKFDL